MAVLSAVYTFVVLLEWGRAVSPGGLATSPWQPTHGPPGQWQWEDEGATSESISVRWLVWAAADHRGTRPVPLEIGPWRRDSSYNVESAGIQCHASTPHCLPSIARPNEHYTIRLTSSFVSLFISIAPN